MTEDLEGIGEEALRKLTKEEVPDEAVTFNMKVPSLKELNEKVEQEVELTPDEAAAYAIFKQKSAKIAQIMTRGIVNDKLQMIIDSAVPEGRKGKFIRDNDDDILRYQNLFYTFDYKEGHTKGLHAEADGRIRVGDVVLMTISEDDLYILRESRKKRVEWKLDQGKQEYIGPASAKEKEEGGSLVQSFDESSRTIHRAHN